MLEQYRGTLFIALAFVSFFMFTTWQSEQQQHTPPPVTVSSTEDGIENLPVAPASELGGVTVSDLPTNHTNTNPVGQVFQRSRFSNDVINVSVNSQGDIVEVNLLDFRQKVDNPTPVRLLVKSGGRTYIAQSGIFGGSTEVPDKNKTRATWQLMSDKLEMSPDQDQLKVSFQWISPAGVQYLKHFILSKGSYLINVEYEINNKSTSNLDNLTFYGQIKRDMLEPENYESVGFGISSYLGAAYSTADNNYEKYAFDDMESQNLRVATKGGWVAFLQHYFVSAWVPSQEQDNIIFSRMKSGQGVIGFTGQSFSVPAGQSQTIKAEFYAGPKHQEVLKEIAKGLEYTIDYGFLFFIGRPIFQILSFLHDGGFGFPGFGNWGLAIIVITLLVKLLLYPIFSSQYRSFAKMRKLQPKLMQLKDRYGNDRQRMSQAMMELYRKEKVNPLGGCFPMLLTMPVFLALYWVLMESVEIRHAPFYFWITDLSSKDPYFVLPILMGASMFLMQKMQPTPPTQDPMQAKIMQMLPVFMTALFLFFPSGLVLYWLVNNLLSIAQQVVVTRQFEESNAK